MRARLAAVALFLWAPAASALSLASRLEGRAQQLKCPFFKRRFLDAAQAARESQAWLYARHKSLLGLDAFAAVPPPPAAGAALSRAETLAVVAADFDERQYYVTGFLSREIYDPRCFFDSPDPDMPVATLGRYVRSERDANRVEVDCCRTSDRMDGAVQGSRLGLEISVSTSGFV